jgi:NADPH2 dehydrogenase
MNLAFNPLRIGQIQLRHQVVLAPLTRNRADDDHIPLPIVEDYYAQRASVPGTLLISEGTLISPRAGGFDNVPQIYTPAQIGAWKRVTDAVHAKGCYIFCQLWALGRAADPKVLRKEGGHKVVSSGNLPMAPDAPVPVALTEDEIHGFIQDYAQAAKNAIEAGFDGVEIHGANGYLCDQFLQDKCNNRDDAWGGSIEKRARFGIEVATAVAAAVGPERTGYRVSPWSPFQGMKMDDPKPQFSYLVNHLKALQLAYLHVVESESIEAVAEQVDFLADIWGNSGALILAGGFNPESAQTAVQKHKDCRVAVAFGRDYLANPDLPFRIGKSLALNKYDRRTFYVPKDPVGYIDYPFSAEYKTELVNGTSVTA